MTRIVLLLLVLAVPVVAADKKKNKGEDKKAGALPYEVAEFIEPDFPFFSSTLDCRDVGEGFPKDNLTPRGLILNLGHNLWACFDIDLLRIACIWESEPGKPPITLNALAPRSYQDPGQKTKDGEEDIPKPQGKVWLANGLYPGWQVGEKPSFVDPRPAGVDAKEEGRGPIEPNAHLLLNSGELSAIDTLHFEIKGVPIGLNVSPATLPSNPGFRLGWTIGAHDKTIRISLGKPLEENWEKVGSLEFLQKSSATKQGHRIKIKSNQLLNIDTHLEMTSAGVMSLVIPPCPRSIEIRVHMDLFGGDATTMRVLSEVPKVGGRRWLEKVAVKSTINEVEEASHAPFVLDTIGIPTSNPWKRNVRLADLAFLDDQGHAAAVTMDGDVWMISGLKGNLEHVEWKRFTSGLHEPMSIVARKVAASLRDASLPSGAKASNDRDGSRSDPATLTDLFVFDRNGIWRLLDTDGDGECDTHEMFCNLFTQTAETREFPNSMKLGPKGELYISKGGQQGTALGKDNGKVLRIAPDGKSYETVAWGLRQPFIGVNEKTGMITASDQQGNYVPSTPLHIIRDNQFYGHLATIQPKEEYPASIADPLTWIPHPVNPSAVTQVWLNDAKMGPLNGEMIHIAYSRPDIFRVMFDKREKDKPQAAVAEIPLPIKFAPLNGHVNPADGCLYLIGYQIWGTIATEISGIGRVRYTGAESTLPCEVSAMDKGILVKFDCPVDKKLAADPDNYAVERWNYKRTWDYGSAHYKLDGTTGQEMLTASSAYVSEDGRSVLVAVPGLTKCDQMHLGWSIKAASGKAMNHNTYFTPYHFAKFDAAAEGFGKIEVDLTPRKAKPVAAVKPSVEEGQRLYQFVGCMGCHSVDGSVAGRLGPSWKGLYGSKRLLSDDTTEIANEAYLRESILEPSKKKAKAYLKLETGMPIYGGILNDGQIESLILYIKSLAK